MDFLSKNSKQKNVPKKRFLEDLNQYEQTTGASASQLPNSNEVDDDYSAAFYRKKIKLSHCSTEAKKYFADVSEVDDPLKYWLASENQFPSLAKMAPSYLAVPASRTPSERGYGVSTQSNGMYYGTPVRG